MEIKESMNTSKTKTDTKGNRKPPVAQEKTVSDSDIFQITRIETLGKI